jgi:hypothetical protein
MISRMKVLAGNGRPRRAAGVVLAMTAALLLSGCGSVKIGRILNEPLRYSNRDVQIEGTVSNSFGAVVAGAYQVDDGTGKIYVLSAGPVPQKGTRVKVDGVVASGVTVMGKSFGTTLRERKHKVRY